jgi:pimeloyl-ACP methyl ester carboxylesterase
VIQSDRALNWSLCRRAFWTNAASDLQSLLAELVRWTLTPELLAQVTTPILVLSAEHDRASTDTDQLYALLPGAKERTAFTAAEGAGMHVEMLNRSLANRRILDWVDHQVA